MRDKIVFFILGGLLATIAYSVGDNNSNAQSLKTGITDFNEIQCKSLKVFGEIQCHTLRIFDSAHKSGVMSLDFNEGRGPHITLGNINRNGGVVEISAENDGASFRMMTSDQVLHKMSGRGLFVSVKEDGTGISVEGKLEAILPDE